MCYNIMKYYLKGATAVETQNKKEATRFSFLDIVEMFVIAMSVVLIIFSFFFRQTVVDGDSMMNTLQNGERLLITNCFYTPERSDIVVFQTTETGRKYPLVKRIIAIEGDTVRIEKNGIYVNGELLSEPYAYTTNKHYVYQDGLMNCFTLGKDYTVPEDHIFVLGDHRDNSADSRSFGFVPENSILGHVFLRIMPFSEFGFVD